MGVVRDPRIAQRAEEDGVVVRLEVRHLLGRDRDPRAQVAIRAVVPFHELELDFRFLRDAAEHLGGLARDLDADAVTGNDCDPRHVGEYRRPAESAPAGGPRASSGVGCGGSDHEDDSPSPGRDVDEGVDPGRRVLEAHDPLRAGRQEGRAAELRGTVEVGDGGGVDLVRSNTTVWARLPAVKRTTSPTRSVVSGVNALPAELHVCQ